MQRDLLGGWAEFQKRGYQVKKREDQTPLLTMLYAVLLMSK